MEGRGIMERKKHLLGFVGLLIATVILAILTYCAWTGIMKFEEFIIYMFTILWTFVTCLTIGFAIAFPHKKIKKEETFLPPEPQPVKDVKEEKVVLFEEVDKTAEPIKDKEIVFEEAPDDRITDKETKGIITEEISTDKQIESHPSLYRPDIRENLDGNVIMFPKEFVHTLAKEIVKELKTDECLSCTYSLPDHQKVKKDELVDITAHVKLITDEKKLNEKIKHNNFDKKIDGLISGKVITTVFKPDAPQSLRQKIRRYLDNHPKATKEELAKMFNITVTTADQYQKKWEKSHTYLEKTKRV